MWKSAVNNVLSLTLEERAWGIPEKRDAMSRPSWGQCLRGQSTSDTANVNVYSLSDVMLLEEVYEHYFQARSSILFSAWLPDRPGQTHRPPHRNTSIELSNICQQKIECNYPQRNPKYLPGTLNTCSCGVSFLIPGISAKRSSEAPQRWMCTKINRASWKEGSCSATQTMWWEFISHQAAWRWKTSGSGSGRWADCCCWNGISQTPTPTPTLPLTLTLP